MIDAQEQYMELEVKIRVMQQVHTERFIALEAIINDVNVKFNWIIGLIVTSFLIPAGMHFLNLS